MKEDIRKRLEEVLPIVDFDSDFLFQELKTSCARMPNVFLIK